MQKFLLTLITIGSLFFASSCGGGSKQSETKFQTPELLVKLPDFISTPDGMAIAPEGDLVVACPNYADQTKPGCLIRISKDLKVTKWMDLPVLPETKVSCPMGIAFAPNNEIIVCDNQGWTGKAEGQFKGRVYRLDGNSTDSLVIIAEGMEHPNGVRVHGNYIYVTQSLMTGVKDSSGLLVSAVYRFGLDEKNVKVSNTLNDKHIIATFLTENKFCQYGADGLVFDSKGNLYVGNFGDGKIHKITFDNDGKVTSNTVFAKTDLDYTLDPSKPGFLDKATSAKMRTTDGICIDEKDSIYVADFSNNAIAKVSPDGVITVLAQNGDTDGQKGELNEPGEPIVWNGKLIVTNFDAVTGPDKVNTKHDSPTTITSLKLK